MIIIFGIFYEKFIIFYFYEIINNNFNLKYINFMK